MANEFAASVLFSYIGWAMTFLTLTVLELAVPNERQSLKGRVVGLVFWMLWVPVTILTFRLAGAAWKLLGVTPLITVPLASLHDWIGWLALILCPLLSALILDFFVYWFHRAQHQWLWRFHAVHHSVREMNAIKSYHHVTESAFRFLFVTIPMTLIVADPGPVLPAIAIAFSLQQVYLHSPTKANFGFMRVIFADNRFHRIHHSLQPEHFDRNFGVLSTVWDRMFGTAYWPTQDEWPDVGLAEVDEPRTVREWLDLPLRFQPAAAE